MSLEETKSIIRRFVVEAFERFNAAAIPELATPEVRTDAFSAFGVPEGPAGMAQAVAILGAAFSNARMVVDDLIAEGDQVVMRYRWAANHTGPIMGMERDNRLRAGQQVQRNGGSAWIDGLTGEALAPALKEPSPRWKHAWLAGI